MSDAAKAKPLKPIDPLAGPKKALAKTKPLRKVLAWCFILHGTIRLGTDFWNLREPFVLTDVSQWWRWTSEQWAHIRGVKVRVDS